jgi:hypothetical protein
MPPLWLLVLSFLFPPEASLLWCRGGAVMVKWSWGLHWLKYSYW